MAHVHQHAHQHQHATAFDDADFASMAELLDLDGEVLHEYLAAVTAWVRQLGGAMPRRRILDVGAGTGTGAIALAQRFDAAVVVAMDRSDDLLARLRAKALDLGLAERIHTQSADLDAPWPDLEPVDLAWASLSMHHLADPDRVLGDIFATLRPGGLFAVVEMDGPPRFLPEDLGIGRPGLEARCEEALRHDHAAALPDLGSDWGPRLEAAGFSVLARRVFTLEPQRPYPAAAGRYAQAYLKRVRAAADDQVDADDIATLDVLIADGGPDSVLNRNDLHLNGSRTVWVGRRPEA